MVRANSSERAPGVVTVLIADDHAAIRAGLRLILSEAPQLEVVGEASDGAEALSRTRAHRPDVVLMDIRMPGTDGIAATRRIVDEGLAQVLVLTTFDLDDYVFGALAAGAAGFLLKTVEPGVLIDAVTRVGAGDGVLAPEVTRRVLDRVGAADDTARAATATAVLTATLTDRERQVLAALGRGLSNQQLAAELVITEATAKTHVSRVLAKLQVTSRTRAALIAREAGLV